MSRSEFSYSQETQNLRRVFDHMLTGTLARVERGEEVTAAEAIDVLEAHCRMEAFPATFEWSVPGSNR